MNLKGTYVILAFAFETIVINTHNEKQGFKRSHIYKEKKTQKINTLGCYIFFYANVIIDERYDTP